MKKSSREYYTVFTCSLVGGGYAGFNGVTSLSGITQIDGESGRTKEAVEKYRRACAAAEAVFRASGNFPGGRKMVAVVRVDGGRAIVCHRRGRKGW